MMGLSSFVSGGGNSSTSNLSASAPPFTVDRLNPNPNSNPMLQYSDSPYVAEPFTHPSYAHLSAPRAEPAIDSSRIISLPVSDGYRFSASASVTPSSTQWSGLNSGYGGDVKPYYNPYGGVPVPPLVGEENLLAKNDYNMALTSGLSVTSQHDYSPSLFDVEYGPQWTDCSGLDEGKRAKRSDFDGKFSSEKQYMCGSHSYENQPYRGGRGSESTNSFKEDAGVLYKNFNLVSNQEVYTGSSSTGYLDEKSCLEQAFHYESTNTLPAVSTSPYPESYPSLVSSAMQKDFPNYQNSRGPYESCIRPTDMPYPKSSPTVVIRPPPATSLNSGQGATYRRLVGIQIVNADSTNASKSKDSGLKHNYKPKDDYFDTSILKFSKQGNSPGSSSSVKDLSSPLHSKSTSDCKVKATLGSQLPDVNVTSGFSLNSDGIRVVSSSDESSFIDHHNTAEDSPCWRGAPSSQTSMFDIEAGNTHHVKINMDEHYGFGYGEHQTLLPAADSNRVPSKKAECNMGNENERGKNSSRTLDATCSNPQQVLLDGTRDKVWIPPPTRIKGVEQISDGPNMIAEELNLLNNSSVFYVKVPDNDRLFGEDGAEMTVNDVSEGVAIAVHAAEKVLASPASQEDATEHSIVRDPGLDVPAIIKTIHSLSELLQSHISSNGCAVGGENAETLKHVINNLSTCLSKKDEHAPKTEQRGPVGETSKILRESSSMGPHMKGERDYTFLGKKDEISPVVSPSRDDDLHMTGDDDMAKAIQKVLEQNFEIDDDMHPQALLFKSLWLESEAKLCSISYKARFERMKIEMEEIKLKASKAIEDTPELVVKARDGPLLKSTSPDISACSMSGNADSIEDSILARLNILKCREENPNGTIAKEHKQPEIAGEHEDFVMARFNILKSRDENPNQKNSKERKQPEIVGGEHEDSAIMARFNILKSREEEKPPQVISQPRVGVQSEDDSLDMADFQYATGSVIGGRFDSYFERNESNSRWRDSSSSEWEHVLKEDFSWKN